jgi:hypothetical protein
MVSTLGRSLAVVLLGVCALQASAKCHVSWLDDDANPTTPPMPQQICDNAASTIEVPSVDAVREPDVSLPSSQPERSCSQIYDSSIEPDPIVCTARVVSAANWQ